MHTSHAILNTLLNRFESPRYLEIGVCKGETFFNIQATSKVAVDPQFQFDVEQRQTEHPNESFCSMPSNTFFERIAVEYPDVLWDVVYIDGLHTYEQAWTDFLNVLPYTHEASLIVFDDTIPDDPYSALPTPELTTLFRHHAGLYNLTWHGDVYKCLFHLHDYAHNFTYATITDCENSRTIVWRSPDSIRKPITRHPTEIHTKTYFDLFMNGYLICPMTLEECLNTIGKTFVPQEHFTSQDALTAFVHPLPALSAHSPTREIFRIAAF